jgi:hypothetical protein
MRLPPQLDYFVITAQLNGFIVSCFSFSILEYCRHPSLLLGKNRDGERTGAPIELTIILCD